MVLNHSESTRANINWYPQSGLKCQCDVNGKSDLKGKECLEHGDMGIIQAMMAMVHSLFGALGTYEGATKSVLTTASAKLTTTRSFGCTGFLSIC